MTALRPPVPRAAWQWVLAAGAVGSVVYAVLMAVPGTAVAAGVAYLLVGLVTTAGSVLGALRLPRGAAAAWWWVAVSQLCSCAASVLFVLDTLDGPRQGVAASQDVAYLLAYPPVVVGVLLLLRRSLATRPAGAAVDAAVLGVGVAALGWAMLVGPVLEVYAGDPAARLGAALFLVSDVVITVLLVALLVTSRTASTSTWLALGAVLSGLAADSTYLVGDLAPPVLLALLSLGWLVGGSLWAAAALHPSASLQEPAEAGPVASPRRLAAMLAGVVLAPAAIVVDLLLNRGTSTWPAVLASCVMSVLVVVRLGVSLRTTAAALAEREQMRVALEHQASHDGLTGLPNRGCVLDRLAHDLEVGPGTAVGLLFIDLDGFKAVNDAHGHRAGDDVLRAVAGRLQGCLRDGDLAGRLGGDEFVVVLHLGSGDDGERTALDVAQRVVAVVAEPVLAAGHLVTIGASVGVATARGGPTDSAVEGAVGGGAAAADALLHEADTAAYRAKAAGRGRVETALRRR